MTTSFYRRQLPDTCIDFASDKGKKIFADALQSGHMESYFPLAAQFHTQAEPAYCGLGTLAMALNSLAIDPERQWKGPWRWFSEELLDCCTPLDVIKQHGITIKEFACLARCNGAACDVFYSEER
jgi:glutathione gamma-glutamylcysteinyltransferase